VSTFNILLLPSAVLLLSLLHSCHSTNTHTHKQEYIAINSQPAETNSSQSSFFSIDSSFHHLVNGSDGIGTGWSSSVNNYDPRAIVANIRRMIHGEPLKAISPFYSGFTGDVRIRPCDQHIIVFVRSKSNIFFYCTDHPRGWRQVRSQGTN
jgi:hypothetical protein